MSATGYAGTDFVPFLNFGHVAADFQIVLMTTIPPMGAVIAMRYALVSAIFIAFSARSRRMLNMRMSASAALRFRS